MHPDQPSCTSLVCQSYKLAHFVRSNEFRPVLSNEFMPRREIKYFASSGNWISKRLADTATGDKAIVLLLGKGMLAITAAPPGSSAVIYCAIR